MISFLSVSPDNLLAGGLSVDELAGSYLVGFLSPEEGPFLVVEIFAETKGTYTYRHMSLSSGIPAPGCPGSYMISESDFVGQIDCSAIGGPSNIEQKLHLPPQVWSKLSSRGGVGLEFSNPILGENMLFYFKLRKASYFIQGGTE